MNDLIITITGDASLPEAAGKAEAALCGLEAVVSGLSKTMVEALAFENALTLGRDTAFRARQASQGLADLIEDERKRYSPVEEVIADLDRPKDYLERLMFEDARTVRRALLAALRCNYDA